MLRAFARRRATQVVLACILVLIGLGVVVHTPPVRRAMLGRAITILQDRLNIILKADSLRYNLLTLRVTLTAVDLSSVMTPDAPFVRADSLAIDLPWSALYGRFTLERVAMDNARIRIVRHRDGTSNLPPSQASTGEPAPIPIGRIAMPKLAVEWTDESSDVSVALPGLAVNVGADDGDLRLLARGTIRKGTEIAEVTDLGGGVSFDGRRLRLDNLRFASPDIAVSTRGAVVVFDAQPSVDLQLSGTTDIARSTRWAMEEPRPSGTVAFDGTLKGEMRSPTLAIGFRSDKLAWQQLTISNAKGDLDINEHRVLVRGFDAGVANGRIGGDADMTFAAGEVSLSARWAGVDAGALARSLGPDLAVRPAGQASGTVSLKGAGGDFTNWEITARNEMIAGRASPNALPVSGTATLNTAEGNWRLVADQRVAGAPLHASVGGRLDERSVALSSLEGFVRVDDTDLAALLAALLEAELLFSPPAVGGTLRGQIDLGGTLDTPRLQATLNATALSVGEVNELSGDLTATGTSDSLLVDARIRQDTGNTFSATGTVFPRDRRLDARVTGRLEDLSRLIQAPVVGAVDVEFAGAGPFDAISGKGTVRAASLTYDAVAVGRLDSTIELDAGTARVHATLDDFHATADARVGIRAPYDATVEVRVDEVEIEKLMRDQKLSAPLTGLVSLTARGIGPLDDYRRGTAAIEITRLDARTGDLELHLLAPGQGSYRNGVASVSSLEAAVGETHISVAGELPILDNAATVSATDALRATLTGDLAQALAAARAAGLVELPPVSGRGPIALLARLTGSAGKPTFAADLEVGPGSAAFGEWPAIDRLQLRAHLEGGRLELSEAVGEWQGASVTANGRVPIRLLESYLPPTVMSALPAASGAASLNARVSSLTPRVLEPFLDADTVAQLEGDVDASLQLETPSLEPEDLTGEMRLDRLDLRIANLPVTQRQPTRIVIERGFARVAAWDWAGEGATLAVQGGVGLQDQQAALQANGRLDLRMLSPFVRDAGLTTIGTLAPRLSIAGPVRNPTIEGQVDLAGGEARLANPRVVIADLKGHAELTQTSGRITSLTGTINGGALEAGGRFEYDAATPMSAELTASVRDMALNFPEGLRSELGADLALRLMENRTTDELGGTLSGTVTVARGSYREPMAVATTLLTRLRTARLAATAVPEQGSLADRLALNVRVVTEEEIRVDNNYGRLELGGDLRLIGTAAAPAISGRTTLNEGGQLFLGRNVYTVESGTIDFANPETIEPNMNITARTRAGGEEIELAITGTPANLSVEPRAVNDPQLGVADVWSLLLTGRTLDEVSGDEAEIVGEQVLGYLSGDVLGLASRAVGIDTIRLGALDDTALISDPATLATEVDPTSRLTFGQSIGEQVDVTFSQNLRDGDAQTWIVDYSPLRQLSLRFVQDDADLRSYQFRHDVSFGADQTRPTTRPTGRGELRVTEVDITGNLVLPEERVRSVLRLNTGDTFDFVEWQRDRDKLEELYRNESYREARIEAQRVDGADGLSLSYQIEAGPRTAIAVSGHELSRSTIAAIEAAWSGTVFEGFVIDDATTIVRRALSESGYLRAEIGATIGVAEGVKTLSISIASGPRTTEYRVQLEGVGEPLARELDRWMRERQLDAAAWHDPATLESALTNELRTRGHLGARVTVGAIAFEGALATLPVTVETGPVFTVSDISLQGARTLYDATLNAIAIEPGSPYDPTAMESARDRVAVAYRRAGFAQVRVSVRPDVKAGAREVALVFQIEEGPRQVLQEVAISGNRGIDSDVVTRAAGVNVGDPIGPDTWLQARSRIFETGLFRRVDLSVEPVETSAAASETQPMRMNVIVQEWPRLRLRYGFAVEEQRPDEELEGRNLVPGLSADVIRRTLFGRALIVGGATEYQRRKQSGRGFLTAPTFMSLPIESSVTLERSRQDFAGDALVANITSISWEQRFRLARRLRLSYSYRYERNRTVETGPPDPIFGPFDVTVRVGRFTGTAAYDARDNVTDTSRGWLLSSSLDYAPKSTGTDFSFVRQVGQAYYFKPWRGAVLASAARIGLAFPLEGQDLIPTERFFLGGARSVRGVGEDGLGPRNFFGDPLGGEASLVFNQEIRFPLYRWFRGVGFVDAGNVFSQPSDVQLGDLRGSMGVGLRLVTPFALLRVDYGRLWSPGASERSGRWTFGLGQAF